MKKVFIILLLLTAGTAYAQQKPTPEWVDQKFSMFIHWGLYSELGGVWDGQPVTRGYSEQIQSFAGIFSDWYAAVANRFNPTAWDPDAVVQLAKAAGMKSIVFTSKHHDGFCMYHSRYTDYNIVDATPFGRDVMKELSEACRRHGIRFAVYYSLIDWHFPEAYPISSHNADPVTPAHHAFSMKQVEEIMTGYGPVSEIWFDMGSLTGEQSRELYELVTRLQPQCMVSGRLGNDRGDFAVMADNVFPEEKLGVPWQTAASFFDETWSYRSWQERGDVDDKVREKIRSLVRVVSRGGNYLLNIGPRGDGSVVPFEQEALLKIGDWCRKHGDAIYGAAASPFHQIFPWGDVTTRGNRIYLFVDSLPAGGEIVLPGVFGTVADCRFADGGRIAWRRTGNDLRLTFPETSLADAGGMRVAAVTFEGAYRIVPEPVLTGRVFTAANALEVAAYSSLDYYSRFQSTVGFNWYVRRKASSVAPLICYTDGDRGKTVALTVDGHNREILLDGGTVHTLNNSLSALHWGAVWRKAPEPGRFGRAMLGEGKPLSGSDPGEGWVRHTGFVPGVQERIALKEKQAVHWLFELTSDRAQAILFEVGQADAMQVVLNGKTLLKRTYTGGYAPGIELISLPLQKGENQLVIKLYNRYEKEVVFNLRPAPQQREYRLRVAPFDLAPGAVHALELRLAAPPNKNSDIGLRDIRLEW